MSRIRSVKPDFFRHEGLQALEAVHPGYHCMLVFEGLWVICDRAGRFEWKPKIIKLDVLPFLDFDMAETMRILSEAGFIHRYEVQCKVYGCIPSWEAHQTFESLKNEKVRFPDPSEVFPDKSGNAPGQVRDQLGKEREREAVQIKNPARRKSANTNGAIYPETITGAGLDTIEAHRHSRITVLTAGYDAKHSRSADLGDADDSEASGSAVLSIGRQK